MSNTNIFPSEIPDKLDIFILTHNTGTIKISYSYSSKFPVATLANYYKLSGSK